MKKKLLLAATSAFALFTLAACSGSSKDIASMKGATITVEDFYNQVKASSSSQQTVQNMIIYKVFEEKYGDKVSKEDVQKEYDSIKEQAEAQGTNLEDYLKQNGYTEKTYKDLLRQSLAYQAGLKAHIEITDEDLKTAWESFHPEVEAQIIQVATEEEATEIKKQLDEGGDFTEIAKEKSTDSTKEDGGKIKFDSQSDALPDQVKTSAFELADNEISEPIQTVNASTYQTSYYIVKMIKNTPKGNDMDPYKDQLKEIAETNKLNDQTFITQVISDELTAANVKIKDDTFSDVLSAFIKTEDSSSADSSSTDNSKTDSSKDTKKEETTKSSSETETSSK